MIPSKTYRYTVHLQALNESKLGRVALSWICQFLCELFRIFWRAAMGPFSKTFSFNPAPERVKTVYLSRHGESLDNLHSKIGGNSCLSERGEKYAEALASFINAMQLSTLKVRIKIYKWLE